MTRARSSQRFRERSGFQCASDRPGCSAAVSPLRRSACGGEVLDAGPFVPTEAFVPVRRRLLARRYCAEKEFRENS